MRVFGWVLFVLGMTVFGLGWVYPPRPTSLPMNADVYGIILQQRTNITLRGGILAICGVMFINRHRRE